MRLVTTLEMRFDRTPDGAVWTRTRNSYSQLACYLEVFDSARIIARVQDVPAIAAGWSRADGPGVSFAALPFYLGPWQYLQKARSVRRVLSETMNGHEAVIFNVPSQIATSTASILRKSRHPYGVRVIGDPHDVFAPGIVDHPLRRLIRWWFVRNQRLQCERACAVAYVNEKFLPARYPPSEQAFANHFAEGELRPDAYVSHSRPLREAHSFTLVTLGSLEQLYKGTDVLIEAVGGCMRRGMALQLNIIGDGKFRPQLEARAYELGLGKTVRFLGYIADEAVRQQLDQADLFLLPSRTEGLPRAIIEAMARALPCIGSTVGGIPELLPPEDLVPPGDATALAAKIREVLTNPQRMAAMSERNLREAQKYHESVINQRRLDFYKQVREQTELWARQQR